MGFFTTFLMATAFTLVTTLESQINSRPGFQAFGFGVVFSALMVGRLVFQVPLGRLSDRLGRKPLVLGGLILMAPATRLTGRNIFFALIRNRAFRSRDRRGSHRGALPWPMPEISLMKKANAVGAE
jgi:MFS family permease